MDDRGIKKLKEFFQALKATGFKPNPILPSFVDKPYCLGLLRRLPQFQAEQFKDDNILINALIEYLKDPTMKEVFLSRAGFTQTQQKELVEALKEEKPGGEEAVEQPVGGKAPAEEIPVGEPSSTMADQGIRNLPSTPSVSSTPRRVIHNIPHAPVGGKEGGTGAGTAATNKAARLADKGVPSAFQKAFENEPAYKTDPTKKPPTHPVDNVSKEATQPAKGIKGGGRSFQAPKMPYQVTNTAKSLGSGLGRSFKLGGGRVANGFGNLLGGIGRGGGGLLSGVAGGGSRFVGGVGSTFSRIGTQMTRGNVLKGPPKKFWLILLGSFFLVGALSAFTPAPAPGQAIQPVPISPAPVGGDISSCTFDRGGDRTAGLKLTNAPLRAIVTDTAAKVGIPADILAGILRVETGSSFTDQGEYNAAKVASDYDAHFSKDQVTGLPVAYGIMQFTPGTFVDTFNRDKEDMQNLYKKNEVKETIDPPGNVAPANVLRIYSIRDSLIASAFKIRADKKAVNGDGPWDEATVRQIAAKYYGTNADGTTNYPGYDGSIQNYGTDLWRSYTGCQSVSSPTGILASCPVQDPHVITNGTKTNPVIPGGGHCDPGYTSVYSFWCPPKKDPGVSNAIDVAASDRRTLLPVYLPTIENKPVDWKYEKGNYADSNISDIGFGHDFSTVVDGHSYFLHLFHLDQTSTLKEGEVYKSSTQVAKMYDMGGPHVHITISKDGRQMEPHISPPSGMNMCGGS